MHFNKLAAELFYPKRAGKRATTQAATTLTAESATMIIMELIDTRKATSKNFPSIQGKYSMSEATEQINPGGIWKKADNSV